MEKEILDLLESGYIEKRDWIFAGIGGQHKEWIFAGIWGQHKESGFLLASEDNTQRE